jgi:serine/threonine protein kinase
MPNLLSFGQNVGDVTVSRLIGVIPSAALYEGKRGEEEVILKVAFPGSEAKLAREADLLRKFQGGGPAHPAQPLLLPAYEKSSLNNHPYGKTILNREALYFSVFAWVEGEFLRDILLRTPQPWYENAAWMSNTLAEAVAFLNKQAGMLHLMVTPDIVLVRTDDEGILRPVLLDLGLLVSDPTADDLAYLHHVAMPAYLPPELTYTEQMTPTAVGPATLASDVFNVGSIVYEMFAGRPLYPYRLRRVEEVRTSVRRHSPSSLGREDFPEAVSTAIEKAIAYNPGERWAEVTAFASELSRLFGKVPAEKKKRSPQRVATVVIVGGAVLFSLFILVAAVIG